MFARTFAFLKIFISPCAERIVARDVEKMACIVESHHADVAAAANLKTIDAAIGSNQPRRCFRFAVDCAHQIKCQITNRAGVRKNSDVRALIIAYDIVQCFGGAFEQLAVTFALGDDVLDVAVNQRVIIFRVFIF